MERFDLCNQHAQNKGPAPASSTPPAASSQLRSHATPRSPAKRRSPSQEEEAGSGSDKWGSATPDASLAREPLSAHKNKSTHTVKKQKTDAVDADAIYAARLQAEENLRARPMRGSRKDRRAAAPPKTGKRKERKKTTNRVRAEDDSDVDGEDQDQTEEKKVNRTSGFHVSCSVDANGCQHEQSCCANKKSRSHYFSHPRSRPSLVVKPVYVYLFIGFPTALA